MSKMKRLLAMSLCVLFLLPAVLNACTSEPGPASASSGSTGSTETTSSAPTTSTSSVETSSASSSGATSSEEPEEVLYTGGDVKTYLREHLPVMDGTVSTIPLEAALRAELFDISAEEARKQVAHTPDIAFLDRYRNFEQLTTELVIDVLPSGCDPAGFEYETLQWEGIPLTREGLAIVVHRENPIQSLTQQILCDIFAGVITNWKEIGGPDAEIVVVNPKDNTAKSFLQNYMGDAYLPYSTMKCVDEYTENAIGFEVYQYPEEVFSQFRSVRYMAIDGVLPSKKTIASAEYPLIDGYYALFLASEAEHGNVVTFAKWAASEEGQRALAKAGYVPYMKLNCEVAERTAEPLQMTGTGMPYPGTVPMEEYIGWVSLSVKRTEDKKSYVYELTGLKDVQLQQTINEEIMRRVRTMAARIPAAKLQAQRYCRDKTHESGFELAEHNFGTYPKDYEIIPVVNAHARNGYLFVKIALPAEYRISGAGYESPTLHYEVETMVWDLFTGEMLQTTDLFYEGVDIAKALNAVISETKQFPGLQKEYWCLYDRTLCQIMGSVDYDDGSEIRLDTLPEGILVTEQPRDMTALFTKPDSVICRSRTVEHGIVVQSGPWTEGKPLVESVALLDEAVYPQAKTINEIILARVSHFGAEEIETYLKEQLKGEEISYIIGDAVGSNVRLTNYGNRYAVFEMPRIIPSMVDGKFTDEKPEYPYSGTVTFDLTTGKEVDWTPKT